MESLLLLHLEKSAIAIQAAILMQPSTFVPLRLQMESSIAGVTSQECFERLLVAGLNWSHNASGMHTSALEVPAP